MIDKSNKRRIQKKCKCDRKGVDKMIKRSKVVMNNYSKVVNKFNPAPSSQSTGKDIDSAYVLAPRIQRCLERTKLIANLVRNRRIVAEYGLRHLSAIFLASLFIKNEASLPNKPSHW